MVKSNKPFIWSLFAGGGLFAAFVIPALIFITGLAVPMGLLPENALAYDRMLTFVTNPAGKLILFAGIFLPLWHAAHRLRMTLHDLGIPGGRMSALVCYGAAALGSIAAGLILISF